MIFIAGLASLTEADRVFLPGEPVKSSFDLAERVLYASALPSLLRDKSGARVGVTNGERGAANKVARQAFLRLFVVRALSYFQALPLVIQSFSAI